MSQYVNGAEWGAFGGRTRYAYLTGVETRNGNTVTLSSLRLYFTMSGTAWGTGSESVSIRSGGCEGTALSTTSVYWDMGGGSTTSNTVSLNDASFSVTTAQTSQTLYLTAPGGDCASFTVTFPAGTVAPDTPTVSIVETTNTSITVSFGTESFGTPSTGTVYLYYGTTSSPTTRATSKTTTGQSTYTIIGLTTGTTYYFRARAYNGAAYSSYSTAVPAVAKTQTNLGFYGSVNSQTAKVHKLLGSVNSVGKCIRKLYGSKAKKTAVALKVSDYVSAVLSGAGPHALENTPAGETPLSTNLTRSGSMYTAKFLHSGGSVTIASGSWAYCRSMLTSNWGILLGSTTMTESSAVLVNYVVTEADVATLVFRR